MAAISDNKYDVFYWIEKIIYSCEDVMQFNASEKLADNYYRVYKDKNLQSKLEAILQIKLLKLIDKKISYEFTR
jgi:hypothetical protein